jgi:hypothetical protein
MTTVGVLIAPILSVGSSAAIAAQQPAYPAAGVVRIIFATLSITSARLLRNGSVSQRSSVPCTSGSRALRRADAVLPQGLGLGRDPAGRVAAREAGERLVSMGG